MTQWKPRQQPATHPETSNKHQQRDHQHAKTEQQTNTNHHQPQPNTHGKCQNPNHRHLHKPQREHPPQTHHTATHPKPILTTSPTNNVSTHHSKGACAQTTPPATTPPSTCSCNTQQQAAQQNAANNGPKPTSKPPSNGGCTPPPEPSSRSCLAPRSTAKGRRRIRVPSHMGGYTTQHPAKPQSIPLGGSPTQEPTIPCNSGSIISNPNGRTKTTKCQLSNNTPCKPGGNATTGPSIATPHLGNGHRSP